MLVKKDESLSELYWADVQIDWSAEGISAEENKYKYSKSSILYSILGFWTPAFLSHL